MENFGITQIQNKEIKKLLKSIGEGEERQRLSSSGQEIYEKLEKVIDFNNEQHLRNLANLEFDFDRLGSYGKETLLKIYELAGLKE